MSVILHTVLVMLRIYIPVILRFNQLNASHAAAANSRLLKTHGQNLQDLEHSPSVQVPCVNEYDARTNTERFTILTAPGTAGSPTLSSALNNYHCI